MVTIDQLLGQSRALDAIRLGGSESTRRAITFSSAACARAPSAIRFCACCRSGRLRMPTPGDWVYVNNFRTPEAPLAIELQAGQGGELQARMQELITFVVEQLPKAFRREDFDQERTALRDKYNARAQELYGEFRGTGEGARLCDTERARAARSFLSR